MELENINPSVYKKSSDRPITEKELDEVHVDPIDAREVFGEFLLKLKGMTLQNLISLNWI